MADVVTLVQDLLFASKIREAARGLGVTVQPARDPEAAAAAARGAALVIIDLRLPRALETLELLSSDEATRDVPSVGFVDHERVDVMEAARARGCGQVLAKGQLASRLPDLLRATAAGGRAASAPPDPAVPTR